jgi:hypothetical protein
MGGVIPPLPQYAFMAWCLLKAQGQLYVFTLYLTKHHTIKKYWGSGCVALRILSQLHPVARSGMRGAVHPLPQYVFIAWCLVKPRDNFTF